MGQDTRPYTDDRRTKSSSSGVYRLFVLSPFDPWIITLREYSGPKNTLSVYLKVEQIQ